MDKIANWNSYVSSFTVTLWTQNSGTSRFKRTLFIYCVIVLWLRRGYKIGLSTETNKWISFLPFLTVWRTQDFLKSSIRTTRERHLSLQTPILFTLPFYTEVSFTTLDERDEDGWGYNIRVTPGLVDKNLTPDPSHSSDAGVTTTTPVYIQVPTSKDGPSPLPLKTIFVILSFSFPSWF